MVNIGGFFASLDLKVDKNSFNSAMKSIQGFGKGIAAFGVGAAGTIAALAALLDKTSKLSLAQNKSAWAANMSVQTLAKWQYIMQEAGVDSDQFASAMVNVNKVFQGLKIGEVDEGFIKALGMLQGFSGNKSADFAKLQGMGQEERLKSILDAAAAMKDQQKAAAIIQKLLGDAGADFLRYMQNTGKTISSFESDVSKRMLLTDADRKSGVAVQAEMAKIKVSLDEAGTMVMTEFGKAMIPYLKDLADWLKNNQATLKQFAQDFAAILQGFLSAFGLGKQTDEQKKETYAAMTAWQFKGGRAESEAMANLTTLIGGNLGSKRQKDLEGEFFTGMNGLLPSPLHDTYLKMAKEAQDTGGVADYNKYINEMAKISAEGAIEHVSNWQDKLKLKYAPEEFKLEAGKELLRNPRLTGDSQADFITTRVFELMNKANTDKARTTRPIGSMSSPLGTMQGSFSPKFGDINVNVTGVQGAEQVAPQTGKAVQDALHKRMGQAATDAMNFGAP